MNLLCALKVKKNLPKVQNVKEKVPVIAQSTHQK
jgi:hypothetical protein